VLWFQFGIWGFVAVAVAFTFWLMRHTYRQARNSVTNLAPMALVPPAGDRRQAGAPPRLPAPSPEPRGPSALESLEDIAELEFDHRAHPGDPTLG